MTDVYLNGTYLPPAEARVPVMDRGFLFGDGVYEVIPVYSRRPFRLDEHLTRLDSSLAGIRLANPHTREEWRAIVEGVVARGEWDDQSVYLQVTRGPMAQRNHAFPKEVTPTVLAMTEALVTPPPEQRAAGVAAVSSVDFRWLRCDLKATSLLANCLLRQIAVDAGCVETLLFRDGFLTEGAASNIFVVKDGVLLAPPKNHLMLPGITYDVVLELAAAWDLPHAVRDITAAEVRAADELWMSSSTKEVLPIVTLDGHPVGSGRPGPVFAAMYGWYQDFKTTVMRRG
ncbi:MAG: D-amino acid aminotransferase [Rhodocyclaceae bacterium]|nr:D-amino acid aminotransferase [Rhodocyclaceae bacterium]